MEEKKIISDDSSKIFWGKNIKIGSYVEIRCLENSTIKFGDNVKLDDNVRIIAVKNSILKIRNNCKIGKGSVINLGHKKILIGENTSTYMNVLIYSSEHQMGDSNFRKSYIHKNIVIGKNCLIGASAIIKPGSIVRDNTFINHNQVYEDS